MGRRKASVRRERLRRQHKSIAIQAAWRGLLGRRRASQTGRDIEAMRVGAGCGYLVKYERSWLMQADRDGILDVLTQPGVWWFPVECFAVVREVPSSINPFTHEASYLDSLSVSTVSENCLAFNPCPPRAPSRSSTTKTLAPGRAEQGRGTYPDGPAQEGGNGRSRREAKDQGPPAARVGGDRRRVHPEGGEGEGCARDGGSRGRKTRGGREGRERREGGKERERQRER